MDWAALLRKPQVWLRLGALLCSIVAIAVIADKGPIDNSLPDNGRCVFNLKEDACRFGIAVGVLTFVGALVFIVFDALLIVATEETHIHKVRVLDAAFSAAWTLLSFICFVFLANEWRVARPEYSSTGNKDAARSAIGFFFFIFVIWAVLTAYALVFLYRIFGHDAGYETIEGTSSSEYDKSATAPIIDQAERTEDPSQL